MLCVFITVDARKLRDEYNSADAKHKAQMESRYGRRAMQQIIEESYSNEYLEREARKCPHCATWISVSASIIVLIWSAHKVTLRRKHTIFKAEIFTYIWSYTQKSLIISTDQQFPYVNRFNWAQMIALWNDI